MTNRAKSYKRDRARLRRVQNPQQIDFLRMRKVRRTGVKYWATKKKPETGDMEKKEPAKKVKKEEPELEVIDAELEEIYSDDDDVDESDE